MKIEERFKVEVGSPSVAHERIIETQVFEDGLHVTTTTQVDRLDRHGNVTRRQLFETQPFSFDASKKYEFRTRTSYR